VKQILFVCTANVCRSPMAEGLMRQRVHELGLDDAISVASAGVWALEGKPASANAVITLAHRGIDISQHIAHTLDIQDLERASIVLVMEEQHRRSIFYLAPTALRKVFLLTEMVGQHEDVADPYGGSLVEYQRTATLLDSLMQAGEEQILRRIGVTRPEVPAAD
jgi:protein-tyrosine phosphatase